jgi:hypothetical protein
MAIRKKCPMCEGTGHSWQGKAIGCPECQGHGYIIDGQDEPRDNHIGDVNKMVCDREESTLEHLERNRREREANGY